MTATLLSVNHYYYPRGGVVPFAMPALLAPLRHLLGPLAGASSMARAVVGVSRYGDHPNRFDAYLGTLNRKLATTRPVVL